MREIMEDFFGWILEKVFAFIFYGAVFFVGVPLTLPYINQYLVTEIAKEMERQRKIAKVRADKSFREIMGYPSKKK